MNGWQITMICLMCINLLLGIVLHDKPKTGKYNFSFTLAGVILQLIILYGGGFFK